MSEKKYKKIKSSFGFISVNPLPSTNELSDFYRDKYYQDPKTTSYQVEYPPIEYEFRRLKYNAILHSVEQVSGKFKPQSRDFLDIGAGEGFFLKAAKEMGYKVAGVDFSSFGVKKFHPELAANLLEGDSYEVMESFISKGLKFDLCSAVNVLEHVIDPDVFLGKIKKILKTNGVVTITVPNDFSNLQELLMSENYIDREFWFAPPEHLHYFNSENLVNYLESNGFECVDAFSDFPIDIFLLHSGSNYVLDKSNGPRAHEARMKFDLLIAKKGIDYYLDYYRSLYNVGIGRDITVVLKLKR